jgi:Holliday junction DNA helicase RuvB
MKITPDEKIILERVLEWEKKANEYEYKLGWSLSDARCYWATINRMVIEGQVREAFHSNSTTGYLVTEECKLTLEAMKEPEILEPTVIDTSHLFSSIVGYEDVKELLKVSLELDKPVHVLLHGPPAIAKSMFLWDIERVFGSRALPLIGSGASKAGIWDLIEEMRPQIILIDELEKMKVPDTTALLSLMQYGRLIRAKHGREMDLQITCWVFATANRINDLSPELLSRFAKFPLREYNDEQFLDVVKSVLRQEEACTAEDAAMIAEQLIGKTHDIRDAIRVARIGKKTGIKRAIELLIR